MTLAQARRELKKLMDSLPPPPPADKAPPTIRDLFRYLRLNIDKDTGMVVRTPITPKEPGYDDLIRDLNQNRESGLIFVLPALDEIEETLEAIDLGRCTMLPHRKYTSSTEWVTDSYYFNFKYSKDPVTPDGPDREFEKLISWVRQGINAYCYQTGTPEPQTIEEVEIILETMKGAFDESSTSS